LSGIPADLVVEFGDVVEAFVDLLAEHLELLRTERTPVQESLACETNRKGGRP
jgi:hypothetical protein